MSFKKKEENQIFKESRELLNDLQSLRGIANDEQEKSLLYCEFVIIGNKIVEKLAKLIELEETR